MAAMAYRLILLMALFGLLGFGGDRLVPRTLQGVGEISLPPRVVPFGAGGAQDDDPQRIHFRFERQFGWMASLGSSTAFRQLLTVSLMAPDAPAAAYERWPPGFSPSYATLRHERTLTFADARLKISAGRYAQNSLDEPAHLYLYADPSRRLHIAWHVVDEDVAPDAAVPMLQHIAASFKVTADLRAKFAEMAGRAGRAEARATAATLRARAALEKAGFGAAAPGKPVMVNGVYAEWMDHPEPRFQLLKPLGLMLREGAAAPVPRLPARADGWRGSVGWRQHAEGAWTHDNRGNAYLPMPGIAQALARRQTDAATRLYYFATTVRVEVADEARIDELGSFFDELPAVEATWQQGTLVPGARQKLADGAAAPEAAPTAPREGFGLDLRTGDPQLDALRRRLAAAARAALPDVQAGRFAEADAAVLAVDSEIQSAVMLGALYTEALRDAVGRGERATRPDHVAALHAHALHWRLRAYPEPHTAFEADSYDAGRRADRAALAALLAGGETGG
ncbi:hypothetical protein [Piscinibacter sp.]|uniref:hypothetical protein n=1 Tax=Piscinibacter sp. TaxID=1903157 RepID=UPI0039E31CCE